MGPGFEPLRAYEKGSLRVAFLVFLPVGWIRIPEGACDSPRPILSYFEGISILLKTRKVNTS